MSNLHVLSKWLTRRFAADSASRKAALDASQRELNKTAWTNIHNRILLALTMRNQGEGQVGEDLAEGVDGVSGRQLLHSVFMETVIHLLNTLAFASYPKSPSWRRSCCRE